MIRRFKSLHFYFLNPFFSSSMIMIAGSNFANFINYLYHTIMGRLLGPTNYSEMAAIFSIINLIGVLTVSLGLVVTKYVSSAKKRSEIERFLGWLSKKVFYTSLITTIIFLLFSLFFLREFLNLTTAIPLIFMSLTFLFSYPAFIYRAVFQGLLKFKESVGVLIVEHSLKLLLGVFLVILGFSVSGAMFGLLLAIVSSWILTRYLLRTYLVDKGEKFADFKPLFLYSIPVLLQSITVASLNSSDLVLVKHFFSAHDAGIYASVSTLGKIIFFGTGPISAVMFPLISQKHSQGLSFRKTFFLSLLLTLSLALFILAIFGFLPSLAVLSLFGPAYLEATSLLFLFGVFMTFYTISYLLINFFLSVGLTKVVILPTIAALIQLIEIWFYHADLLTVININIAVSFILMLSLGLFYLKEFKLGSV